MRRVDHHGQTTDDVAAVFSKTLGEPEIHRPTLLCSAGRPYYCHHLLVWGTPPFYAKQHQGRVRDGSELIGIFRIQYAQGKMFMRFEPSWELTSRKIDANGDSLL